MTTVHDAPTTPSYSLLHMARIAWRVLTPEGQKMTEQEVRQGNVGKRCTWSTPRTRGRGRLEHTGAIEAYVPAGTSLAAAEMTVRKVSYSDVDAKDVVRYDRYLVREDREGRGSRTIKSRRYAPRCSDVEVRKR